MDIKFIRRDPPPDTKNIRIVQGEIDVDSDSSYDSSSTQSISPDRYDVLEIAEVQLPRTSISDPSLSGRQKIWNLIIDDKKRVVSQGDLKYDLGDQICALLPYYINPETSSIENLKVVSGTISDINFVVLDKEDVPRETRLRYSPDPFSHAGLQKEWAEQLIVKNWREPISNSIQTMIVSYVVKLDSEYVLRDSQIKTLYAHTNSLKSFPYSYNLKFTSDIHDNDTITIDYQYVMGLTSECFKSMAEAAKKSIKDVSISDIDKYTKNFGLYSGVFVKYVDQETSQRTSGIVNFIIIDHVCVSSLNIKFVVKCDREPTRILAISKITGFDVRLKYPISKYKLFHPLERYVYEIIDPNKKDFNELQSVKSILTSIFLEMKVYVIKKSLCLQKDLTHVVYEDRGGNIKIVQRGDDIYFHDSLNSRTLANPTSTMFDPTNGRLTAIESKESMETKESPQASKFTPVKKTKIPKPPAAVAISKPKKYDNSAKIYDSNSSTPIHASTNSNFVSTGISLGSYVKGLAYPEGQPPTDSSSYIFFHSKDYTELILDPNGYSDDQEFSNCSANNFMQFVCTANKHDLFRNPSPDDVILAIPFVCDREVFKGKVNLKWFYPEYQFRLLHLYITTNGEHPHFKSYMTTEIKPIRKSPSKFQVPVKIRNLFKDSYLSIFDLYVYGLSRENPTLASDFTKAFIIKYFWWERLLLA